jgi:hypothetical protein
MLLLYPKTGVMQMPQFARIFTANDEMHIF